MGSNLPTPNTHVQVLERNTFNTIGKIESLDLTQVNYTRTGNAQQNANTQLTVNTNKGILGGSVAAVAGAGIIGPCLADGTHNDLAVGVVVNDAVGNPFESSSAVASQRVVYMHGTGTVFSTDVYETADATGNPISYAAGDFVYASQNGLLTNKAGRNQLLTGVTTIGIVTDIPSVANSNNLTVNLRI